MTKAVNSETLDKHLKRMGFVPRGGRADKASQLNNVKKVKAPDEVKKNEVKGKEASKNVVSPQCVRVHDTFGRQEKGRRWITG